MSAEEAADEMSPVRQRSRHGAAAQNTDFIEHRLFIVVHVSMWVRDVEKMTAVCQSVFKKSVARLVHCS